MVASALCLLALYLSQKLSPGLITVWLSLKCLSIGRVTLGLFRLAGRNSPFRRQAEGENST